MDDRQHAGAQQDDPPVLAQHLRDRQLHGLLLLQQALHVFRLFQAETDDHADDDQGRREQEGNAPAPEDELGGRQAAEGEEHHGRQQVAGGRALLGEGGVEDALALGRAFAGDQDGATPFAAHRDALDDAQHHQRDRRPYADFRVDRQHADAGGGDAHHDQGDHQGVLAADPVAEVAEDDAAERAGDEAGPQRDEGQQRGQARVHVAGEEHLAEYQRGGQAIDVEVIPLDGGADEGGDTRLAGLLVEGGVVRRRCAVHGASPGYFCFPQVCRPLPHRSKAAWEAKREVSPSCVRSVLPRGERSLCGTW
ncbi:hypothetical protein D9M68_284820 [compost metagenome]